MAEQRKLFRDAKEALIEDDNKRWEFRKYEWLRAKFKDRVPLPQINITFFTDAGMDFWKAYRLLKHIAQERDRMQLELWGGTDGDKRRGGNGD